MLVEKNFFNLLYKGGMQLRTNRLAASTSRYQRIIRADYGEKRSARKTKDMIAVLLSHGARATRAAQPRAKILMNVYNPRGAKAVKIKLAK